MKPITKEIQIEELVDRVPGSVGYLLEQGIKCIACGEPIWDTLEAAAQQKGFSGAQIDRFVGELNRMLEGQ